MSNALNDLRIEGEAARALLANICDVIGDDEEMIETAVEGETGLLDAIKSAVDRVIELGAFEEALASQIKALSERKERFSQQAERIKAAVHVAMGQACLKKLEFPQATISVRAVPPKVEVFEEAAVPSKYWKAQDPKLDKKAVLEALKAKEDVPGARLSNGSETISLRVK